MSDVTFTVSARKRLTFLRKERARDERGRFTSGALGGGHGAGPASMRGGTKPTTRSNQASIRTWTNHVGPGIAGKDGHAGSYDPATGQSTVETWHGHFDKNPDDGGVPSAQRNNDVHVPIMERALAVPPPKPGEKKIAILTMGGPGSGKSSVIGGIDRSNFVKVDPDDIKSQLPEWKRMTDPNNSYRGAAMAAHEESSYLAKQIRDQAIADGKNVSIDGTGNKADNMTKLIAQLHANGYETHVHFAHVPVETGLARAEARADHTGRYVSPQFIASAYKNIPGNFGRIAAPSDAAYMHDNSGQKSHVVASKVPGGAMKEHDAKFMQEFRNKHGGM